MAAKVRKNSWLEDAIVWARGVIPGVISMRPLLGATPLEDRLEVCVRPEKLEDARRVLERHPRIAIDLVAAK